MAVYEGGPQDDVIKGSGESDSLNGYGGSDTLYGRRGDDQIDGGDGADVMYGQIGNDTFYVDHADDLVIEFFGEGVLDTVRSSVSYRLRPNLENLVLVGTAVYGVGNKLDNYIIGNDSNNRLDGRAGTDTLEGGKGNDTYYLRTEGDVAIERIGEGRDAVVSSFDHTLGDNLENLRLVGSAIKGIGNGAVNVLFGNDLDNILDGAGGSDLMAGGRGDDRYHVNSTTEVINERAGEGYDTVFTAVDFKLRANVEELVLQGDAARGTGNLLDNKITALGTAAVTLDGRSGDDTLKGGSGQDVLIGGAGNDRLVQTGADSLLSGGYGDDVIDLGTGNSGSVSV